MKEYIILLIINNTTDLLRVFFLLSLVVEIKYHYSMTRKTSCMDGLVSPIIIEMQNVSPNILTDNDYYWERYRYDAIVALLRVKSWPGSSSSQDRYRIEYRLQCTIYRHEETGDRALQLFLSRSVRVSTLHTLLHRHIHKQVGIIILRILLYQKIVMKTL